MKKMMLAYEELKTAFDHQSKVIDTLGKYVSFNAKEGTISFSDRTRELLGHNDNLTIEEADAEEHRVAAKEVQPRSFWKKVAHANYQLTEEERQSILKIGQAPPPPETFVRTHIRFAYKAVSFREKRLQAKAFIKALGIKPFIADYSILGSHLEVYIKQSKLPNFIEAINNHRIISDSQYQPWQIDPSNPNTKEAAARRLSYLLARADHPNLRKQIVLGFGDNIVAEAERLERELRTADNRQPAVIRPESRKNLVFKPLTLADFESRLTIIDDATPDEDPTHRDGEVGQP
jgi:hypothetical protein